MLSKNFNLHKKKLNEVGQGDGFIVKSWLVFEFRGKLGCCVIYLLSHIKKITIFGQMECFHETFHQKSMPGVF